jgi:hypothetical protein
VNLAGRLYWEPWGKLSGLLMVFTVYSHEIAAFVIVALVLAIAIAIWRGLLRMHPLGWALMLVGGVVYLALPRALFDTHLADQRLPVALAFMLIACIDLDLARRGVRRAFALAFAVLLMVHLVEVQVAWDALSYQSADVRRSTMGIERGARVLVVHGDRDAYADGTVSDFGLLHAASLATIERSALVSSNFVVSGKHVLQVREPFRRFVTRNDRIPPSADWLKLAAGSRDETDRFYWSQWHLHFDYVYVLFARRGRANPDAGHLVLAREGQGFQLYRVIR